MVVASQENAGVDLFLRLEKVVLFCSLRGDGVGEEIAGIVDGKMSSETELIEPPRVSLARESFCLDFLRNMVGIASIQYA